MSTTTLILAVVISLGSISLGSTAPALAATSAAAALVGTWVQDEMGPVLTHERIYRFNRDGTYEFLFTARNTGSTARRILVRERGRYALRGSLLVITPQSGQARSYPWRVERDPYVGDIRLVLVLPNGILDIYYRR